MRVYAYMYVCVHVCLYIFLYVCFSACMYTRLTLAVRTVSNVGYTPVSGNSSTGGWFGILGGTHEKDCVVFMSRLKIVSGLPYKIVIESWNAHASSSSQEALLWKTAARGSKEKRERSQSVPVTFPASYSSFLRKRSEKDRRVYLLHSLSLTLFFRSEKDRRVYPLHSLRLTLVFSGGSGAWTGQSSGGSGTDRAQQLPHLL